MAFKKRLTDPKAIPLLFEVVPPKKEVSQKELNLFINQIINTVKETKIDALDIPDLIQEEKVSRKRSLEKVAPRQLAKLINQKIKIPIIINRVTVFDGPKKQREWLIETYQNYKIKYLILIGAPDNKPYPGLSASQAAQLVTQLNKKSLTDFYCGAITIPTRRLSHFDEPERMINKQKAGIKFFLSQIIFESQTSCQFLKDYYQACQKEKIKPGRIFLSFAPVSNPEDLQFLKSLQVFIPQKVQKILLEKKNKMVEYSISTAKKIFADIFAFCQQQNIEVPLGINVNYVRKQNFQAAKKLLKIFTL